MARLATLRRQAALRARFDSAHARTTEYLTSRGLPAVNAPQPPELTYLPPRSQMPTLPLTLPLAVSPAPSCINSRPAADHIDQGVEQVTPAARLSSPAARLSPSGSKPFSSAGPSFALADKLSPSVATQPLQAHSSSPASYHPVQAQTEQLSDSSARLASSGTRQVLEKPPHTQPSQSPAQQQTKQTEHLQPIDSQKPRGSGSLGADVAVERFLAPATASISKKPEPKQSEPRSATLKQASSKQPGSKQPGSETAEAPLQVGTDDDPATQGPVSPASSQGATGQPVPSKLPAGTDMPCLLQPA